MTDDELRQLLLRHDRDFTFDEMADLFSTEDLQRLRELVEQDPTLKRWAESMLPVALE
jgi:hypothetical protein